MFINILDCLIAFSILALCTSIIHFKTDVRMFSGHGHFRITCSTSLIDKQNKSLLIVLQRNSTAHDLAIGNYNLTLTEDGIYKVQTNSSLHTELLHRNDYIVHEGTVIPHHQDVTAYLTLSMSIEKVYCADSAAYTCFTQLKTSSEEQTESKEMFISLQDIFQVVKTEQSKDDNSFDIPQSEATQGSSDIETVTSYQGTSSATRSSSIKKSDRNLLVGIALTVSGSVLILALVCCFLTQRKRCAGPVNPKRIKRLWSNNPYSVFSHSDECPTSPESEVMSTDTPSSLYIQSTDKIYYTPPQGQEETLDSQPPTNI